MQDALRLIREDLGPDAAVLHTREVNAGVLGGMFGGRQIEVTASTEVEVPSRLPQEIGSRAESSHRSGIRKNSERAAVRILTNSATKLEGEYRSRLRESLYDAGPSLVDQLSRESGSQTKRTAMLFNLLYDLTDCGVPETVARELIKALEGRVEPRKVDILVLKSRLERLVEEQLQVRGPIRLTPGRCQAVALVGPTGVGKTTTIAKLAANFRLNQKCRVGLITVDTYRIAAVDQLKTYADIMDLPMEVVTTPDDMQAAVQRMADLDLVLIDTSGRSPRDASHMQDLHDVLAAAKADEIHLVLSSVTSNAALERSVEQFRQVGASHLLLTKVDEAAQLGSLLPLLQTSNLPLTYIANGQCVPNDLLPTQCRLVARLLLGTRRVET
jgi:flagellar biosynthesis protein FlhF